MKIDAKTQAIIDDFERWVSKMEDKHEVVSADIYIDIMRYLNRMDRQIKRDVKRVMAEPLVKVPEKYKTADWLRNKENKLCTGKKEN